jgi:hypothetical protein
VLMRLPPGDWEIVSYEEQDGFPKAPKLKMGLYCAKAGVSKPRTKARDRKRTVVITLSPPIYRRPQAKREANTEPEERGTGTHRAK